MIESLGIPHTEIEVILVNGESVGFDALYRNDWEDDSLTRLAADERRTLLTRDREILKRSIVTHGYFVRADKSRLQLKEVCERLDLWNQHQPYRRCIRCNGLLVAVDKAAVEDVLEPRTKQYFDQFWRCDSCGRIYWRGSHVVRMEVLLENLTSHISSKPVWQ